jgi:small-conductance mechanosensitive channel
MKRASVFLILVSIVVALLAGVPVRGADDEAEVTGAPVYFDQRELFRLHDRVGSITPSERAELISRHIDDLAHNPFRDYRGLTIVEGESWTDLVAERRIILTLTDLDAQPLGIARRQLAVRYQEIIDQAVREVRERNRSYSRWQSILMALLNSFILLVVLNIITRLARFLTNRLEGTFGSGTGTGRFSRLHVVRSGRLQRFLAGPLQLVQLLLICVVLIIYLTLTLGLFPSTRRLASQLEEQIRAAFALLWEMFTGYLPNLFVLLVILLLVWGALKITKVIFEELRRGTVKVAGFDAEWAGFTQKIAAFLIIIIAAVVAFPYLPGAKSPAFQGISIFLGVLLSLSSSSLISNILAGVILTYTGAFRLNDRIRIGEVTGDVIEKRLLVTILRTIKNEDVSIPNSLVINNHIVNYSAQARTHGLILHTAVTIGYDVPWRQVEELLVAAARTTAGIQATPPPFVLQTGLNDFNVTYELNAYTDLAGEMAVIYSRLHSNIQEQFAAAGVEIMSPGYLAIRDGNARTLPVREVEKKDDKVKSESE